MNSTNHVGEATGELAEGVFDGGGDQEATTEKDFKAMCHLHMKLGLRRRRMVATISMKISHWPTDGDAGLRGALRSFINKSLVASCSASMQSH